MSTELSAKPSAAVAALNGHFDTRTAAYEIAAELSDRLDGRCDLLLFFSSFHHRAALNDASEILRSQLAPTTMVGCTAESVLAGNTELEGRAGLSALALRFPENRVGIHAFALDDSTDLTHDDGLPERLRAQMSIGDDHRATILLADPFTTPINRLLPALSAAPGRSAVRVIGGLASGASQPGMNSLLINDKVVQRGAVGVSLSGDVRVDALVSQGCRPVGQPWIVTRAEGNRILELGGRNPMDVAKEMALQLPDGERRLLAKGVLIGLVANEYKDRFGRGDFVVRAIIWADTRSGAIAVGDLARVGQTVQFHVRDAETAHQDLDLLLDAQQLEAAPLATLLFTCNSRGSRLFRRPSHDAALVHRRLARSPLAGLFAAGEIGPIGNRVLVHGHTACAAIVRVDPPA